MTPKDTDIVPKKIMCQATCKNGQEQTILMGTDVYKCTRHRFWNRNRCKCSRRYCSTYTLLSIKCENMKNQTYLTYKNMMIITIIHRFVFQNRCWLLSGTSVENALILMSILFSTPTKTSVENQFNIGPEPMYMNKILVVPFNK